MMAKKREHLCKDWSDSKDNPKRCAHYVQGGACLLPGRIRCIGWLLKNQDQTSIEELMSHSCFPDVKEPIEMMSRTGALVKLAEGDVGAFVRDVTGVVKWRYSFSSLYGMYAKCRRSWYWYYVKRVARNLKSHYLLVGGAAHEVMASLLSGNPFKEARKALDTYADVECDDERYLARLEGVRALTRSFAKRNEGVKIETEKEVHHCALPLHGYIDGFEEVKGTKVVHEHKFAASIKELETYQRAQALFYFFLDVENHEAVMFNLFKKPDIKTWCFKSGETIDEFRVRLGKHVEENFEATYFRRLLVSQKGHRELDDLGSEVVQLVGELELARVHRFPLMFFPRNVYACRSFGGKCDYYDLCQTGQLNPALYHVEAGKSRRHEYEAEKGTDE